MNRRAYLANASILDTASRNAMISSYNALNVGETQAAAAKAGLTENAVGKGLSAAGSLAGMGISSYSLFAKTATPSTAGVYDWNGSSFASNMA